MSIYDRIGGAPADHAEHGVHPEPGQPAADDVYARVLADRQLAAFFTGTDLQRLKAHQRAFIAAAIGARKASRAGTWPPRTPGSASETMTSTPSLDTSSARSPH